MPIHLGRPPRADANDALAMLLLPILRLRIDEYITLSAIEPFNDPTGWYLGLLLIVFSKRLSSYDTVTLCLDSISLIALSNFFLSCLVSTWRCLFCSFLWLISFFSSAYLTIICLANSYCSAFINFFCLSSRYICPSYTSMC